MKLNLAIFAIVLLRLGLLSTGAAPDRPNILWLVREENPTRILERIIAVLEGNASPLVYPTQTN